MIKSDKIIVNNKENIKLSKDLHTLEIILDGKRYSLEYILTEQINLKLENQKLHDSLVELNKQHQTTLAMLKEFITDIQISLGGESDE